MAKNAQSGGFSIHRSINWAKGKSDLQFLSLDLKAIEDRLNLIGIPGKAAAVPEAAPAVPAAAAPVSGGGGQGGGGGSGGGGAGAPATAPANYLYAGPASGPAGAVYFRAAVPPDYPFHSESLTDGQGNFIFAAGDIVTVTCVPN